MKIAIFSTQSFEKPFLMTANAAHQHELVFFDHALNEQTVTLATGFTAISCFVTCQLTAPVLKQLAQQGIRFIALRSAGFNHVDLSCAKTLPITILRVPAYSPYAVAEFAVGLILTLNRKIHRAYQLVREQNFLLTSLLGFDLHGKSVGIIGTGNIGSVFAKIMHGFGCHLLGHDPYPNETCLALGLRYVTLDELYASSDIISLHCPLNPHTRHLINPSSIAKMKHGVMLINTGRGALIDTVAVIQALKKGTIGYLGMDVYEEEENLFFQDLSNTIIQDDVFARLQTFPNVMVTAHQAFFTKEAITHIAETTLTHLTLFDENPKQLISSPCNILLSIKR